MAEAAPLKICMVTTFYPPYHFGGDAIYVHRLVEALAARGHRVDLIHSVDAYRVLHPDEPELEFEHHPNVRLHSLRTVRPRLAALRSHQTGRPGAYDPYGGAISAEHGIGVEKRAFLPISRTPAEIQLMKSLKIMMDPNNILNPGKVIQLDDSGPDQNL